MAYALVGTKGNVDGGGDDDDDEDDDDDASLHNTQIALQPFVYTMRSQSCRNICHKSQCVRYIHDTTIILDDHWK